MKMRDSREKYFTDRDTAEDGYGPEWAYLKHPGFSGQRALKDKLRNTCECIAIVVGNIDDRKDSVWYIHGVIVQFFLFFLVFLEQGLESGDSELIYHHCVL
jgi:hypothetical protein